MTNYLIQGVICLVLLVWSGYLLADHYYKFQRSLGFFAILLAFIAPCGWWYVHQVLLITPESPWLTYVSPPVIAVIAGMVIRRSRYPLFKDYRRTAIECTRRIAQAREDDPSIQDFRFDFMVWGTKKFGESFEEDGFGEPG